MINEEI
jgi:hypothetical protein